VQTVGRCQNFGGTHCLHLQGCWHLGKSLHGAKTKNIIIKREWAETWYFVEYFKNGWIHSDKTSDASSNICLQIWQRIKGTCRFVPSLRKFPDHQRLRFLCRHLTQKLFAYANSSHTTWCSELDDLATNSVCRQ
jgi:hypothetical protein